MIGKHRQRWCDYSKTYWYQKEEVLDEDYEQKMIKEKNLNLITCRQFSKYLLHILYQSLENITENTNLSFRRH